jgi:peptidoglycan-associated lipoprotein
MKKATLSLLLASLLAACAGPEVKEAPKAAVEERSPAAKAAEPAAQPQPMEKKAVEVSPLKDPANILSKRSVYFDFDKYDVKDEYKPMIEAHAKYVKEHGDTRVTLQGNTDERGSREYNIALGQRRAESVKKMMTVLGVADRQIETVSFGEEKPRATCHDESCWKENRRTDIVYPGE